MAKLCAEDNIAMTPYSALAGGRLSKALGETSKRLEADRDVHRQFLRSMENAPNDAWKNLVRVMPDCIGCGICEKVCPSGSIRLENGKAVHMPESCQTCLACVHNCPHKGIGLDVPEKNPDARYRNEHVRLEEIIRANYQNGRG